MIEVRNLTKKYGPNTVVKHLNFTIESGKIYGFLGPNGAGKSTTMNMITGCLAPTEGDVIINGHNIMDEPRLAKKSIGYLPEIPPLYPDMTPDEYLHYVARAKGVRKNDIDDQVEKVMAQTNITSKRDRLIKNLSKGYKQRVGISQALLGDPELIILDEPTVGLDPKQILEIRDLILSLGTTHTVILSSHILAEISAVCDHVMIISNGSLVASDTLENIRREYISENIVVISAKCNFEKVQEILSGISGIIGYESIDADGDENTQNVRIEVEAGIDIREQLFFAFAKAGIPLVKLASDELSLEEVFLRLTEDNSAEDYEEEDEEESYAASASDSEASEDDSEETEEDEDEDASEDEDDDSGDDDYKPLFGGRKGDDN